MTKKQTLKLDDIENAVYGKNGLYARVIAKLETLSPDEAKKITGKKQQYISTFKRQFKEPEKFDSRPKLDTIKEMAQRLGVE